MEQIAPEDILRRLRLENPWWGPEKKIANVHRSMVSRAYLDLFLPLVKQRDIRRAVVLMGPRRVGKTVMIHHTVQSLLDSGVPAQSICYISVDSPLYNGLRIEEFLQFYGQAAGVDHTTEEAYIFLDEIQYLRKWEIELKGVVDVFPNLKCVASGSAAAALRLKSEESGAGRFTDFLLPPLTFYEYLLLLGHESLMGELEGGWHNPVDIQAVNQHFVNYLNYGGYPEVIFSKDIQADPVRFIKSDIIDKVLLRDLPSLYGIEDIQELNYLFTTLAFNTSGELSLGALSQKSGVANNTIKRYISYLEAAFLIKTVHRVDHSAKRFRRANFFKVYLTNPSMRAALFSPADAEDRAMGALAETAVFSQWFHSDEALYYARWQDGEVDMVALGRSQQPTWAVEVKWTDRYCDRPEELAGLVGFLAENGMHGAVVTTRTRREALMSAGKFLRFVPTAVYCYGIGYELIRGRAGLELGTRN